MRSDNAIMVLVFVEFISVVGIDLWVVLKSIAKLVPSMDCSGVGSFRCAQRAERCAKRAAMAHRLRLSG